MFEHARRYATSVDNSDPSLLEALRRLRRLSLDEFAQILAQLPTPDLPHLSKILPSMAPADVQKTWTGSSGDTLLRQSASFMNFLSSNFVELTGRPLMGAKVLDFGCGWGRLLRLMAYFNEPEYIYGCDAWSASLNKCKEHRVNLLANTLALSDAIPTALPFEDASFDLTYAFSIFTHLPEMSATACMASIRKATKDGGLAVISVRPIEYWDYLQSLSVDLKARMKELHRRDQVAFYPANGEPRDAAGREAGYGATSIPLNIVERLFPGWEILKAGATLVDPYQIFVVLRAV